MNEFALFILPAKDVNLKRFFAEFILSYIRFFATLRMIGRE